MDTRQQNDRRQRLILSFLFWSIIPAIIAILIIIAAYHAIYDQVAVQFHTRLDRREAVIATLQPEMKTLQQYRLEQLAVAAVQNRFDAFIASAKTVLHTFDPSEAEQMETEISRLNAEYENVVLESWGLTLSDSLTRICREKIIYNYTIVWRHTLQGARSDGNEIKMLKDQLTAAEDKIHELRKNELDGKTELNKLAMQKNSGKPGSAGSPGDYQETIAALQRELKDLRSQAGQISKEYKKQNWDRQLKLRKQFVFKLQRILDERKKIDSVAPKIRALIREMNQEIEKMELNPDV